MPVTRCSNKKYRIGSGDCIYKTKKSAEEAYQAYRYKQLMKKKK